MKKHTYNSIFKILIICFLGLCLANCEGEDGAIGPNGENGADGKDGSNGENGVNGDNAIGYDDAVKYGSIQFTVSGENPNGEAFTDENTYKFTANNADYNNFTLYEDSYWFYTSRFLNIPTTEEESHVRFALNVTNIGQENQSINRFSFGINQYYVTTEDLSIFSVSTVNFPPLSFEVGPANEFGITDLSVTNFSFDNETNNLKFSFSYNVGASTNSTAKELSISGEVDLIIFKNLLGGPERR